MNILLIGSGGREHALAWKIMQSETLQQLHVMPGSDAMIEDGATCHDDIDVSVHQDVVDFCKLSLIDLVVVGPEVPLVAGLADDLRAAGIDVFGPSKAAAQLEGSKAFMKDLCMKYGIPTAGYGRFTCTEEAKNYVRQKGLPIVIKADGLAAGKGVIIAKSANEAEAAIEDMLAGNLFGKSGSEIVIEEFLEGEEMSVFALCDGQDIVMFGSAQDHKTAYDGDQGPNTGGMGAYSPAHMMTAELEEQIKATMIVPTVKAMAKEGCEFHGVLFAGVMLTKRKDGALQPKLLEYNVRFGDPECQVLMMRLQSDITTVLQACARGVLKGIDQLDWANDPALCVVMAAQGYPNAYDKGSEILLPLKDTLPENMVIFHAGTKKGEASIMDHSLWNSVGGRVLGCAALGANYQEAQDRAYDLVTKVEWREGFCRTDIGYRAV